MKTLADCIAAYIKLWSTIRSRCDLSDSKLARVMGVQKSTLSRMLTAKQLPRRMKLIVEVAKKCAADESEIRVLLAIAGAIQAHRDGNRDIARYFVNMFDPLYARDAFRGQLNSIKTIVTNILVDNNVPLPEIMNRLREMEPRVLDRRSSNRSDLSAVVLSNLRSWGDSVNPLTMAQLMCLLNTYSRLISVDLKWPWVRMSHTPRLRGATRDGTVETYTCAELPHVQATQIIMKPAAFISEKAHPGIEFVLLCNGSGTFTAKGLSPIALRSDGRRLLAHSADLDHSFRAGDEGAELFVIEYLRPSEGRIHAAISNAERRTFEINRSKRLAESTGEGVGGPQEN